MQITPVAPIVPPMGGWFGGYPVAPWYPVVPPAPALPQYQIVEKSYVLDYTSALKDVIMETENQGLTFRNTYGLEKFSVKVGSAKAYIHHDRLGSVDFTTDDFFGGVLSYVDYDPWGVAVTTSPWTLGVRKIDLVAEYTGHPYDVVLGLYFAEARMYDAADRRFVANDPYKGDVANPLSLVQYTYVLDNPLKWADLLGLEKAKVIINGQIRTVNTNNINEIAEILKFIDPSTKATGLFKKGINTYSYDRRNQTTGNTRNLSDLCNAFICRRNATSKRLLSDIQ
jgi:RHS repeat-associated protein